MKNLLKRKHVLLLWISLLISIANLQAQVSANSMHKGVLRVKFKREISTQLKTLKTTYKAGVLSTGIKTFDVANTEVRASKMKRVFPYSAKNEARHSKHGLDLWYEITFDSSVATSSAVSAYKATDVVEIAEPVLKKILIDGKVVPLDEKVNSTSEDMPFDDPYLDQQWHYHNDGSLEYSVAGADINAFEAWKTQAGQSNVIVSVVDGGIDIDHVDLKDNLWVNEAELNGVEGVDDDGNGYIDDIHGYNFADASSTISAHEHGTHVAGTVAAVNNNGIGVCGVAGGTGNNDGARLMSSQVFTSAGGSGGFAQAIVYGADNGAVISQNSWGYTEAGIYEQMVLDAIDYFIAEAGDYEGSPMKGGIVIFAAGNDYVDTDMYPGYYDKTFCVAALGPTNQIANYSNYGSWVDISAPGGDMNYGTSYGVLSTIPDNKYGFMQGTSMACPHMSGVAALAVSQHAGDNFTADELRLYLESSTHDVYELNPDFSGKLGVGYIDAAMVLKKNEGIKPDVFTDLQINGVAQDLASLSWSVPNDEDDGYPSNFQLFYNTEPISESNLSECTIISINNIAQAGELKEYEITSLEPLTTYYFAIRSMDRWANKSELSEVLSATTNAGPEINIAETSFDYTLNESNSFLEGGEFTIENHAEGLLKWEATMRHKSHSLTYNNANINYPKAGTSASSSHNLRKITSRVNSLSSSVDKIELSSFSDQINYGDGTIYILGDADETVTNSSAMKYYVDREDGFNLTDVQMYLLHDPETGPMVMEVYKGQDLTKDNLLYAQEVDSYYASAYNHSVHLDEQLYFNYGETFWIVFHVPAGNTYCLEVLRKK